MLESVLFIRHHEITTAMKKFTALPSMKAYVQKLCVNVALYKIKCLLKVKRKAQLGRLQMGHLLKLTNWFSRRLFSGLRSRDWRCGRKVSAIW